MKNSFYLKLIKYTIGGGLAAIIDLLLLKFFTDFFGIYYLYSSVLAFIFSFLFGFLFQKYITFVNKKKEYLKHGFIFLVFQLVGQGINMILLFLFVTKFGFYYFYVAIFNKGVVFIWNYIMNYLYNFK